MENAEKCCAALVRSAHGIASALNFPNLYRFTFQPGPTEATELGSATISEKKAALVPGACAAQAKGARRGESENFQKRATANNSMLRMFGSVTKKLQIYAGCATCSQVHERLSLFGDSHGLAVEFIIMYTEMLAIKISAAFRVLRLVTRDSASRFSWLPKVSDSFDAVRHLDSARGRNT